MWLEEQLDRAAAFYEGEVEQRNWYGLFNYGDFMHTYDRERHVWRYDMGGYAWDNTDWCRTLVAVLMFMRTGRPMPLRWLSGSPGTPPRWMYTISVLIRVWAPGTM